MSLRPFYLIAGLLACLIFAAQAQPPVPLSDPVQGSLTAQLLQWPLQWHPQSHPQQHLAEPTGVEALTDHRQQRLLLFGMLYGALTAMVIYNLFLAFSVRERGYFYYVGYLIAASLLLAANEGHLAQYLWPDIGWPRLAFYTVCFALQILGFYLFSAHFLQLQRQQRPLYQLLSLLTVAILILITVGQLLGEPRVMRAALGGSVLLYVVALAAGIRLRLTGMASADHYVLAILSLLLGLAASALARLGILPGRGDPQDYTTIGTVVMLMLFSLALADRINQLRRENRAASSGISKANEETQRINAELGKAREERQRLEQLLAQAREEGRAKSDYLAAISHQVRTPMNGILGMAELLRESPLDNSQLHYIHAIERSGRALVEIISELVDFADIEAGNLHLALDPFDPERVVDDCLSILSLAALEKRNNLIADVDPTLPRHLRGDARKLQQVLLNLLGNAIKFTEDGDIVVRVRRSTRPAVNSAELLFEVLDTGRGIASELLPHLFTPFTAHDHSSSEGRGTGLGLPISKQLIELMDGQIGVESTPGEGSRFWFTARCLFSGDTDEAREQPFMGRRILLVEAHPVLGDSLERTLNGWGALVTRVGTTDAAKQILGHHAEQSQPFDVALIEHQLPSGSGLHLAAEIVASDLATPPMILITSVTTALSAEDLTRSGIEIVLEKPVTHHQLKDTLESALGQYQEQVSRRKLSAGGPSSQPRAEADLPLQGMRVVVAEDNSVNQMVIAALLRKLGVEPIVVGDGLAAVDAVREQHPDAVLMDCEMPEMDGYQAARQIRSRERREGLPAMPIIALSAHATSEHQERAVAAGIDNYLTKPVTGQALKVALSSVYRERAAPASSMSGKPEPTSHG